MEKVKCPKCKKDCYTACPQIKNKCAYCDFHYSISDNNNINNDLGKQK